MQSTDSQVSLNQAEWENPDNWSSIYFSRKDSRTFVPKRNPRQGMTINFGSTGGARWIYYLFGIFFLTGCLVGIFLTALFIVIY